MGYGDMVIWWCLTVCPCENGKYHRENVDKPWFLSDKPMHFGWISPKIHQPGLTLTWLGSLLVEVVSARAKLGAANLHRTVETTMGFQSPPNRCWLHKNQTRKIQKSLWMLMKNVRVTTEQFWSWWLSELVWKCSVLCVWSWFGAD